MTEREWLAPCAFAEYWKYLKREFPKGGASDRKLRLFGVACCRRIWGQLTDPRSRRAVAISERFADGAASEEELDAARQAAGMVVVDLAARSSLGIEAANAACYVTSFFGSVAINAREAAEGAVSVATKIAAWEERGVRWDPFRSNQKGGAETKRVDRLARKAVEKEREAQRVLLRDIIGNPFKVLSIKSTRLTPKAISLARDIYDNHAFGRLPALGDALEEGGCTDTHILDHCRGDEPHVRGCWVIDLVLGMK